MQRFLLREAFLGRDIVISEPDFVHQISHVLRSRIGDSIIAFNGDGHEYLYAINSITKKEVWLTYKEKQPNTSDPSTYIRVYQALPNKYEKLEYIVQKWVEVGVREFVFFRAQRSQKLVINERKIERFQDILHEALEQCGGNKLASIVFSDEVMPTPIDGVSYILHTKNIESMPVKSVRDTGVPINIFIGPEWGWSDEEIEAPERKSSQMIHLGNRILRTETAGPLVAFVLMNK